MRLPAVLSAPNEIKPFPSPPKCSGISRFHNDRHRDFQTRNFRSHHQLRHPNADPAVQLRPVGGAHDGAVEELLDAAEGTADEKPKKRRTGRISVGRSTRICKQ
ncbi:hypothetical protein AVEN_250039-1, partial [Araneus ventricosus]